MQNLCLHFKKRQKKGKPYCYCTKKRAVIEFFNCKGCPDRGFKKVAKKGLKTPIKKVSKKRLTVSDKTYNIVLGRSKDFEGVPHCQF